MTSGAGASAAARAANLRGIGFMVAAMFAFASADAFIKLLASEHPAGQIIWVAGLGGTLVLAAMARGFGQAIITRDILAPGVLARVALEAFGTIAIILALSKVPLATVSTLMQSVPLFVTLGAMLFLGESVGWRRWAAIGVGMAGVLLILRPGTQAFTGDALFPMAAALCLAGRDLSTRLVPPTATTLQLGVWGFAGLIPAGLGLNAVLGTPDAMPSPANALLFALIITTTVLAILGITQAMRMGDVSAIAPFRYSRLVFGLLIAVMFFGERPDAATWAGAAIIVGAGLYAWSRERRAPDR